jgi:hypothetical protein
LALLADIRTKDGMIDFWAHTEEVISPEQITAWQSVVDAVSASGDVWVAPLRTIAKRQQLIDQLVVRVELSSGQVVVVNPSRFTIPDVVIELPAPLVAFDGTRTVVMTLPPMNTLKIAVQRDE